MNKGGPFLALWTMAVGASVAAFVLHLALRGRNVELGYDLGKARSEQARLREVKRVLELEAASYETPQRVEVVARTLLGMQPPLAERIVPVTGVVVGPVRAAPSAGEDQPPTRPATDSKSSPLAGARAER